MLPSTIKKIFLFLGCFWLLCFLGREGVDYYNRQSQPEFLTTFIDTLPQNPAILRHIGEYHFNTYTYQDVPGADSLQYALVLMGSKGKVILRGFAFHEHKKWVSTRPDTTYEHYK
jgi:hypothetical protein